MLSRCGVPTSKLNHLRCYVQIAGWGALNKSVTVVCLTQIRFFLSKAGWLKGPPPIYGKFQSTTNQLDKFNRLISENMCICICICTCVHVYICICYMLYIYVHAYVPTRIQIFQPKSLNPTQVSGWGELF